MFDTVAAGLDYFAVAEAFPDADGMDSSSYGVSRCGNLENGYKVTHDERGPRHVTPAGRNVFYDLWGRRRFKRFSQPLSAGRWQAGENCQLSVKSPLVGGPCLAAGDIGGQVRILVENAR